MSKRLLKLLVLGGLAAFGAAAPAAELDLLDKPFQWRPEAEGGMALTAKPLDGNGLLVEAEADGGGESYPRLSCVLPEPLDLRRYQKLELELELTSSNPDIVANGKNIVVCLYDETFCQENSAQFEIIQQTSGLLPVRTGAIRTVAADLTPMQRGKVDKIDVYLYERPYSYPHEYTFRVHSIRLKGADDGELLFDREVVAPSKPAPAGALGNLTTADGLSLQFRTDGMVGEVSNSGQTLSTIRNFPTGWLVRDAESSGAIQPVGGNVELEAGKLTQQAELEELQLRFDASVTVRGDYLELSGTVESLNPADRAVTVYWALPVRCDGSRWYYGLNRSIDATDAAQAGPYEPQLNDYPFCSLAGPAANLALAVDLGQPTDCHFNFNPAAGVIYVAFNLGLADIRAVDGRSLRQAEFKALLFQGDPAWGLRSICEKYYGIFPEYFADRIGHGGSWELTYFREKSGQTLPAILDGGFRFNWTALEDDRESFRRSADNGIKNLLYIEPQFLQFSMGDYTSPTNAQTMARLTKLIAQDPDEWDKFNQLHYTKNSHCGHPYSGAPDDSAANQRFITALLKAAESSGQYSADGEMILNLGWRGDWIFDSGFGAMIPCNLSPAIPDGKGQVNLETVIEPVLQKIAAEYERGFDGIALDCFPDFGPFPNDYRRENFRFARYPLSFDPDSKQLMNKNTLPAVDFLNTLAARYRPDGMMIFANVFGEFAFAAPQLDVFGVENLFVPDPAKFRMLAGNKTVTYVPYYADPSKASVEYHLLWGIYPGRDARLEYLRPMVPVLDQMHALHWQPVTAAVGDSPDLRIERYGQPDDGEVIFALHNAGKRRRRFTVHSALPAAQEIEAIFGDSEPELTGNGFAVTLEPQQTAAVKCLFRPDR